MIGPEDADFQIISNPVRHPGPSDTDFIVQTDYLSQELIAHRGKSTCYSTSVVNAAIALGVVSQSEAIGIHQRINDELISHPDLWQGAFLKVGDTHTDQTPMETIANIIERHLEVRLGKEVADPELGRVFRAKKTFLEIQTDLDRDIAHVITVGNHAYAFVGADETRLTYIDPLRPQTLNHATLETFNTIFAADNEDKVITTPVHPKRELPLL